MNETVSSMNGTLWIFAALLIGMVVVQSLLFLRQALQFNKRNNLLTPQELRSVTRTGTISVIGPAISTIVIALSLIAMVGSAATYMRSGVIGAPAWELLMAQIAVSSMNVEFNTPQFTKEIFVLCLFGMSIASAPYFINTIITLKPLDAAVTKSQSNDTKKESFIPVLGNAAMMGILGYSIFDYFKSIPQIVAILVSGTISYLIIRYIAKSGKRWLGDWSMAISMVIGMVCAQIVSGLMG